MTRRRTASGFTIVELLIVIVVIAILASIATTTYGGMQQRASNTARIADARKMASLLKQYIAVNGAESLKALVPGGYTCLGEGYTDLDSGPGLACSFYDEEPDPNGYWPSYDRSNSGLDAALKQFGDYSISAISATERGTSSWLSKRSSPYIFSYGANALVDGQPGYISVLYELQGNNVDCQLSPLLRYVSYSGGIVRYTTNHSHRNYSYGSGTTSCNLYIPAP